MKLIIDILEQDYERLKEYKEAPFCSLTSRAYEAIANGVPLPKGYDRYNPQPCEDAISREDALMCLTGEIKETDTIETIIAQFGRRIRKLPPVNPQTWEDAIRREDVLDLCDSTDSEYKVVHFKEDVECLPSVNPRPKWISVSEGLPEDEQEILFSTKTGRVHSGKYYDDASANQWYSHKDKCRAWNNVVSAWMPLPAPFELHKSEDKR